VSLEGRLASLNKAGLNKGKARCIERRVACLEILTLQLPDVTRLSCVNLGDAFGGAEDEEYDGEYDGEQDPRGSGPGPGDNGGAPLEYDRASPHGGAEHEPGYERALGGDAGSRGVASGPVRAVSSGVAVNWTRAAHAALAGDVPSGSGPYGTGEPVGSLRRNGSGDGVGPRGGAADAWLSGGGMWPPGTPIRESQDGGRAGCGGGVWVGRMLTAACLVWVCVARPLASAGSQTSYSLFALRNSASCRRAGGH
jgi:hypothetical protein